MLHVTSLNHTEEAVMDISWANLIYFSTKFTRNRPYSSHCFILHTYHWYKVNLIKSWSSFDRLDRYYFSGDIRSRERIKGSNFSKTENRSKPKSYVNNVLPVSASFLFYNNLHSNNVSLSFPVVEFKYLLLFLLHFISKCSVFCQIFSKSVMVGGRYN